MSKKLETRGLQDSQTIVKNYLNHVIQEGDWVIDATAGKGRDTVFLAQCVGPQGKVIAFDIQEEAIKATLELLTHYKLEDRVLLWQKSHTTIAEYVHKKVKAVIFNLGYLPGCNKEIKTNAETTLIAVKQALEILEGQGVIALTVYQGHPGGLEEAQALNNFLETLAKKDFSVIGELYEPRECIPILDNDTEEREEN